MRCLLPRHAFTVTGQTIRNLNTENISTASITANIKDYNRTQTTAYYRQTEERETRERMCVCVCVCGGIIIPRPPNQPSQNTDDDDGLDDCHCAPVTKKATHGTAVDPSRSIDPSKLNQPKKKKK